MRFAKAFIFGLALSALAGSVFAGEDTTYREHCTGKAYWKRPSGLVSFDQRQAECGSTVHAG